MKRTLTTLCVVFIFYSLAAQDFNTMAGDWMRVKAEYINGDRIPNNHSAHVFTRYRFAKKEVLLVFPGNAIPGTYTRTGNILKIGPVQSFLIEEYTDKSLTLVESAGANPIRYYLIPIDSFHVSAAFKYPYEIVDTDTIYSNTPGIEPIYPKGKSDFMNYLMAGFTQEVGFNFSYVVQKDGTIGDVTIAASTNPKLNKRLIQLVKKTSGKWIPGTYKGKAINVRENEKIAFNTVR
jgi:hypothetical protein